MHNIITGKLTIAHELGHALYGNLFDTEADATSIDIGGDASLQGWCEFAEKQQAHIPTKYSRLKDLSDLGGIFGELMFSGSFGVYGARSDLDDFVTVNKRSQSSIIGELYNWFWLEDDDLSYKTITKYECTQITEDEMINRLPWLYDAYQTFNQYIDEEQFTCEVDELHSTGVTEIDDETIRAIIERVVVQ